MVNALLHRFNQLSEIGGELRPGIVHRLDKETSGLVIGGEIRSRLTESWQNNSPGARSRRHISRLVHGWPKMTKGTVNAAISRDLVRRARMTTRRTQHEQAGA